MHHFKSSLRKRRMAGFVASSLLSLSVCAAPEASAQTACPSTTGKTIEQLVDEGKQHAREAKWVCARALLSHAYAKREAYDVAGNLGIVTYELAKQQADPKLFVEAATHIDLALRGMPLGEAETLVRQRRVLEERLKDSRTRVVSLSLDLQPAGACIVVSGRDAGCGPFAGDLFAPPGTVSISFKAPGYQSAEKLVANARAGSRHTVTVDLTNDVQVTAPSPKSEPETLAMSPQHPQRGADASSDGFPLWPSLVIGGVGIAAFGAGAAMWISADTEKADAVSLGDETAARVGDEAFCAPPVASEVAAECAQIDEHLAQHDEFRTVSTALFIGGGVLVAGAAVTLIAHLVSGDEDDVALWVAPSFSPNETAAPTGLVVGGSF